LSNLPFFCKIAKIMSDCDSVNPNVRDICDCTRPGMTLLQCNQRRALWGLPPLLAPGNTPEPEPKPLTTIEKVTSFLGVSAQTVWRYVTMQPGLLTNEEMEPRLAICRACDRNVSNHCTLCGCACNPENKVKWMSRVAHPDAHCPIDKW